MSQPSLFYAHEVAHAVALADVVDLFAGPRGWSEGLHLLDPDARDIGVELDRWANATARAAGHLTVEADVSEVNPTDYAGARGLIASPPCQAFSTAGTGHGREHLAALLEAVDRHDWTARPHRDPNVWLVLEVGRWISKLAPEWIACEQVPAVLPIWERYAAWLSEAGYSTWTGILNAADYGVPQIRKRAVLIASRTTTVDRPPPSHSKDGDPLEQWITMAEALGWTGRVGFPRLDDTGTSEDGYRERDWNTTDNPSHTLTEKARSWLVSTGRDWRADGSSQMIDGTEQPAPTVSASSGGQWHLGETNRSRSPIEAEPDEPDGWVFERPSTTIAGDARAFSPGGHKANDGRDNSKQIGRSENTIMLEIADALRLQSFRADYPVKGTKTKQFEQIGNAVPPLLAAAVLRQVIVKT